MLLSNAPMLTPALVTPEMLLQLTVMGARMISLREERLRSRESVRACRRRKRAGHVLLKVEVDLGGLADLLVDAGFLPAWDSEDRDKVRTALEVALDVWSRS
jgi:hypothetical protein